MSYDVFKSFMVPTPLMKLWPVLLHSEDRSHGTHGTHPIVPIVPIGHLVRQVILMGIIEIFLGLINVGTLDTWTTTKSAGRVKFWGTLALDDVKILFLDPWIL